MVTNLKELQTIVGKTVEEIQYTSFNDWAYVIFTDGSTIQVEVKPVEVEEKE